LSKFQYIYIYIFFKDERNFLNYQFIPSIESDEISDSFLPAHPEILMKTANPIPIITGVNNLEGMVLFAGKLIF